MTRRAAFRIGQIVKSIDGDPPTKNIVAGLSNGYQFMECCDIEEHWTVFASIFLPLSWNDFITKFDRVRECRNDVYHHKSVAGMTDVVAAAEELLDRLNFSLAFVYDKITATKPSGPKFSISIESRHRTW